MVEIILAAAVGLMTGFIFSFFKLPIPAPSALPGIIGIVGVFVGAKLFEWASRFLS